MTFRVLDKNDDGSIEWFDYDADKDTATVKVTQDVEPIIEKNKAQFNEGLVNRKSEFRHTARVPVWVAREWCRRNNLPFLDPMWIFKKGNERELERFLNDADNRFTRTLPGYVKIRSPKRGN